MKTSARPAATRAERAPDLARKPSSEVGVAERELAADEGELVSLGPSLLDACIGNVERDPGVTSDSARVSRARPLRRSSGALRRPSARPSQRGDAERQPHSSARGERASPEPRDRPRARGPPRSSRMALDLDSAWSDVLRGPAQALPHREELEQRFGRSLGHLRVYSHAGARRLLERLHAHGAVRDGQILLRGAEADPVTLVHEVVHALQPRGLGSSGGSAGVVRASEGAEREARRATRELLTEGRLVTPLRASLAVGSIALRDLGELGEKYKVRPVVKKPKPRVAPERKVAAKAERKRALQTKVDAVKPKIVPEKVEQRKKTLEDGAAAVKEKAEENPVDGAEASAEKAEGAEAAEKGEQEKKKERTAKGGLPPSTVNRAEDIRRVTGTSQKNWLGGKKVADDHVVDPASQAAVGEDHHPFARGPPLVVPALSEESIPYDQPVREAVEGEDLDAANENTDATLAQIVRRRAGELEKAQDKERQAERTQKKKEVDQAIEAEIAKQSIEKLAIQKIKLEGDDEATQAKKARDGIAAEFTNLETIEHARNLEDYGEKVLGPKVDPTLGHDVTLDALKFPPVDVIAQAPEELLEKVATDETVGVVPIDEMLLVEDDPFLAAEGTLPSHLEAKQQIDQRLNTGTKHFEDLSKKAVKQRDEHFKQAEDGVTGIRGKWKEKLDQHIETRKGEAKKFGDDKVAHAKQLRDETEKKAKEVTDKANADADKKWAEARTKAEHKAEEAEDKAWWEKAIDVVADLIEKLTSWLADFIRACRDAIISLLDAAKELANDLIDAGRDAIDATFDLMRAGLDIIAENLPGEAGEIARDFRDKAFEFLDDAQETVDGWADDLKTGIDDGIDFLKDQVDESLSGLADTVENTGAMIADLLRLGLMPWLRKYFPEVADLVDHGLSAPVKWAAETLDGWLETVLEGTGLSKVQRAIEGVEKDEDLCMGKTPEEQAEDCAAFESLLQSLLDRFDRLLKHPIALRIKAFLKAREDAEAEKQVDSVSGFFSFIGYIAKPIAKWWDRITSALGTVIDVLKEVAGTVWREFCSVLGIDPEIDPIEAIKEGIQTLWDGAVAAVKGIIDGIKEAWRWLKEDSPFAGIIDFFARLPELWEDIKQLWDTVSSGVGDWLASAAKWLQETFIPPVQAVLNAVSTALHAVIDVLGTFGTGMLTVLDALLEWTSDWEVINFLADILKALVRPIRFAIKVFCDCVLKAFSWVADGIKNLLHYLRVFLDITVGIVVAIALGPIGIAAFFVGSVWLYLVPQCYKAPIINFLLDVAIKFIEFFPEPADFVLAAIYQGALSFLRTLRKKERDADKVKAVDLVASIFAGNVEVAAGIVVGVAEGVWESTGGTIIFLFEVVAWLITLPFKLIGWAADIISGKSDETDPEEEGAAEPAGAGAAEGEGEPGDVPEAPLEAQPEEAEVEDTVDVAHPGRGPPPAIEPEGVNEEPIVAQPAITGEAAGDPAPNPSAETDTAEAPDESVEERGEEEGPAVAQEDLEEGDSEDGEAATGETEEADEAGADAHEAEGDETEGAEASVENDEDTESVGGETPRQEAAPSADVEAAGASDVDVDEVADAAELQQPTPPMSDDVAVPMAETGDPLSVEKPPDSPQELPALSDILSKVVNEGFSKAEIKDLLDTLKGQLKAFVGKLAEEAANTLLDSLTAKGSAYQIGRTIGMVLGMILVEAVLAYFTAGASVAVSAAKTALSGVKLAGRLGQAFVKIKKAIDPLLKMLSKLKKTVQAIIGSITKWLDDVFAWIKRIFKRRPRGPPKGPHLPHAKPPIAKKPSAPKPKTPKGKKPKTPKGKKPKTPKGKKPKTPKGKKPKTPKGKKPKTPKGKKPKTPKERKPGKKKKKKKDKKKDRLSVVARRAALAGWRRAKGRASRRVILDGEMRQLLKGTQVKHKPTVRVRVDIDHEGTHAWRVKATVRKGRRRATARSKRGWLGHDEKRRRWLAAAKNQEPVHKQALLHADERISKEAKEIAEEETELKHIHHKLEGKIRKIEKDPKPRLLGGVEMEIDEMRFKEGKTEKKEPALIYDYRIAPNTIRGNRLIINAGPTVSLLPTYSTNHTWLKNAKPRIRNLECFKFYPKEIADANKATNGGFFKFEPKTPYAQLSDELWLACDPEGTSFNLEDYEWTGGDRYTGHLQAMNNPQRATPKRRTRANDAGKVLHPPQMTGTQKRMLERLHAAPGRSLTARAFKSLKDEESAKTDMLTFAPKGMPHARTYHVLGSGGGIDDEFALAMRAAFHLIPGLPTAGVSLGPNGVASAWRTQQKADAVARNLLQSHFLNATNWPRVRRDLAVDIDFGAGRSATTQPNPFPGSIIVAQKFDAPKGVPYPAGELPAHHATAIASRYAGLSPSAGTRKLVASDPIGAMPPLVEINPVGLTPNNVMIRIVTGPKTRQWVLNTMYPT